MFIDSYHYITMKNKEKYFIFNASVTVPTYNTYIYTLGNLGYGKNVIGVREVRNYFAFKSRL